MKEIEAELRAAMAVFDRERQRERNRRQRQRIVGCCKQMAAFLFSHVGLAAMVVAYSIAGGILFRALEAPAEQRVKLHVVAARTEQVESIWRLTEEMVTATASLSASDDQLALATEELASRRGNFTENVVNIFRSFQTVVQKAVKNDGWDGNDDMDESRVQWSFAGALLYAVTVITTIGYGHVAPKTPWGRLLTIVYALIGIPLTFLYLSNIGNFLADCFRLFYKKVCCDVLCCEKCDRKRRRLRLKMKRRREILAAAEQYNMQFDASNEIIDINETTAAYDDESGDYWQSTSKGTGNKWAADEESVALTVTNETRKTAADVIGFGANPSRTAAAQRQHSLTTASANTASSSSENHFRRDRHDTDTDDHADKDRLSSSSWSTTSSVDDDDDHSDVTAIEQTRETAILDDDDDDVSEDRITSRENIRETAIIESSPSPTERRKSRLSPPECERSKHYDRNTSADRNGNDSGIGTASTQSPKVAFSGVSKRQLSRSISGAPHCSADDITSLAADIEAQASAVVARKQPHVRITFSGPHASEEQPAEFAGSGKNGRGLLRRCFSEKRPGWRRRDTDATSKFDEDPTGNDDARRQLTPSALTVPKTSRSDSASASSTISSTVAIANWIHLRELIRQRQLQEASGNGAADSRLPSPGSPLTAAALTDLPLPLLPRQKASAPSPFASRENRGGMGNSKVTGNDACNSSNDQNNTARRSASASGRFFKRSASADQPPSELKSSRFRRFVASLKLTANRNKQRSSVENPDHRKSSKQLPATGRSRRGGSRRGKRGSDDSFVTAQSDEEDDDGDTLSHISSVGPDGHDDDRQRNSTGFHKSVNSRMPPPRLVLTATETTTIGGGSEVADDVAPPTGSSGLPLFQPSSLVSDPTSFRGMMAASGFDPFGYDMDVESSTSSSDDAKVTVPVSICLVIIAGYIFAGAVLFTLWEDWDLLTGSYFCFITLSTIGFGDIVPGTDMDKWASHEKLVLCALWLAFGLSLLAMCFNLMQEEVKEKCKWLGTKLGLLKDESEAR